MFLPKAGMEVRGKDRTVLDCRPAASWARVALLKSTTPQIVHESRWKRIWIRIDSFTCFPLILLCKLWVSHGSFTSYPTLRYNIVCPYIFQPGSRFCVHFNIVFSNFTSSFMCQVTTWGRAWSVTFISLSRVAFKRNGFVPNSTFTLTSVKHNAERGICVRISMSHSFLLLAWRRMNCGNELKH